MVLYNLLILILIVLIESIYKFISYYLNTVEVIDILSEFGFYLSKTYIKYLILCPSIVQDCLVLILNFTTSGC